MGYNQFNNCDSLAFIKLVYSQTVLLLKIYEQRRQLDILTKDAIISRNIAFERIKRLKRRFVKVIQLFWLISVSFFHRKNVFSVFASFKVKFFKKNPERCYLHVVPKIIVVV